MRWLQHFLFGGTLPVLTNDSKQAAEARANHRLSSEKQQLQGSHKVLYDAVGELSPGLSEEAFSTLCEDARALELNQITLNFCNSAVEAEFQQHVAVRRRPVLLLVFCFDVFCYLFRMAAKFVRTDVSLAVLCKGIMPQLCNMGLLYFFLGLLNRRSRRLGDSAARQEEFLLTGIVTLAICNLLATINEMNPQDYVYAAMFMISTTCFLKIQWLLGTAFMSLPLLVTHLWHKNSNILPTDAMVHLTVSWAVGGFMSYLSDTYRRQMFVNHRLAKIAAEKELQEAQARIDVQQQLSAAQAQAAQRAIVVVREKAANEAKSEFMSLMCHEVRTPLNGCLASAEMLLEMPLQEEQRELAKTIRVSGSILLSTVSNFLDFFKMEAGKQLDVVRTEMTTKDLVGDIHCIIEATIGRSSSVMLERPNTDGVPDYVLGDPDRLRGILLNLYTNAAKFTKRGSIALRVRVANKNYRPSPAQVIAQQRRGPHARLSGDRQHAGAHQAVAEQNGQCQKHASWGSISCVSPQKKPVDYQQLRFQREASALGEAPGADSDNALTGAGEQWRKGLGAQAATNAGMALHRGHDAEDASNAINQTQNITTPVQCEHRAGHALLQHAAQAIDSAADKLQADAGLSPVGSRSRLGFKLPASDPLEPVKEDAADSSQAASGQGEAEVAEPPMTKSQDAVSAGVCQSQRQSRHAPLQHAGAPAKLSKSTSGRVSSTSVLDQQDDCSSCSGGSAPSDSRAPPPDADSQSTEVQRSDSQAFQEDTIQRDSNDAPDRSYTVRPRSASLQSRHSGTTRSPLGERTQSNSDITEPDTSYRCSSGSFSDYSTPLRKSLSSPALHEAAVAGGQNTTTSSGQRCSLGGLTATSYNGMASEKATVGKTEATTVQNLGDGWFDTVARRKAPVLLETLRSDKTHHREHVRATDQLPDTQQPSAFQCPVSPADPASPNGESGQWLVFEVTDTGCGISQHALSSLFTEYVQGTEDDMKRPRTRGGTGLGLSICSKQVSVLGGLLGAMSKVGEGSTFWFTIPLLKPTLSFTRESLSMRRTASWGSRDAFTDGHISHHADPPSVPAGRRTLAATTRAHRHKRHYTPARSAKQVMQQQQQDPVTLQRTPSMAGPDHVAGNLTQRQFPSEEAARRMSAPAAPQDRAESGEIPRKASGMQSAASNDSTMGSQGLEQTTARARAAVARAVLYPQPSATFSSSSSSDSGRPRSSLSSQDSLGSAALPERESKECEASTSQPRQHRHVDGSDEGTTPRNDLQRNLLAQYKAVSEGSRMQAKAAEGKRVTLGGGQPLQPLPEGSPSPFQAQDGAMMQRRAGEKAFGSGQSPSSSDSGSRELNVRPSMEARRRRLGLSALQGRSVLLAEDNLINQRVAKMMLCSLGMCCEVASNGQEAVDAVLRRIGREDMRQFDVLLMDMAMPVMGGVDATKEIRRAGAAVPIVAMTANSSDKDRDECLEAGMDGFLSKPVLKDRLAEAILNAVSGRRQFQDRQTISLKAYDRL